MLFRSMQCTTELTLIVRAPNCNANRRIHGRTTRGDRHCTGAITKLSPGSWKAGLLRVLGRTPRLRVARPATAMARGAAVSLPAPLFGPPAARAPPRPPRTHRTAHYVLSTRAARAHARTHAATSTSTLPANTPHAKPEPSHAPGSVLCQNARRTTGRGRPLSLAGAGAEALTRRPGWELARPASPARQPT